MSWIDLHMHSNKSDDGEFDPKDVVERCHKNGVKVAALTDHNTTDGVLQAMERAQELGIEWIPAVELDCVFKGVNLHVIGYYIDPQYPKLIELGLDILKQEREASLKRIEKVRALGINFDEDEVKKYGINGVINYEMIAEAALEHEGNRKNSLLAPYFPGGSRSDHPLVNFYWDFCSQGKPAEVPLIYIGLRDAIDLIKEAGGITVLAHPGNNIKEDGGVLQEIIEEGIQGIEVFSSYHHAEQAEYYLEMARKCGVAITCGSDFHGKIKPTIEVGDIDCKGLEQEIYKGLILKKQEK